jgi:hypothetical protein
MRKDIQVVIKRKKRDPSGGYYHRSNNTVPRHPGRVRPIPMKGIRLFKVLSEGGCSANGGGLDWDLPKNGRPGKWHAVQGKLELCSNGLHVSVVPGEWGWQNAYTGYESKRRLFLVEVAGRFSYGRGLYSDKVAFRAVRLVKELKRGPMGTSYVRKRECRKLSKRLEEKDIKHLGTRSRR